MKILITGGAGFIGSHLVENYIEIGHEVAVIDNLNSGNRDHIKKVKFYDFNITEKVVEDIFSEFRPDVVNHHAAQVSIEAATKDPRLDAENNIGGTLKILECCILFNVRKIIFASSCAIYGDCGQKPISEDKVCNPCNPYAISKLASEMYIKFYGQQHGLAYTIFRYSNVYGPRQSVSSESGVVPIFFRCIKKAQQPTIYGQKLKGDKGCYRDYVFIGDVAIANTIALTTGDFKTLNVGTGVGTNTFDLFYKIAESAGIKKKVVNFESPRSSDIGFVTLDNTKIFDTLGWKPSTTLEDGLNLTSSYYLRSK